MAGDAATYHPRSVLVRREGRLADGDDFLLGPPLVGGLAEVAGLRTALGVVAVAGLAVFLLSLRLQEPGEDQGNPR